MLSGLLRAAGILAGAAVLVSFALFAVDETRDASDRTAAAVAGLDATRRASPDSREERARERAHGDVREAIDDANDVLVAPFAWAVPDGAGSWVARGLPALMALVVFGLGLPFLARWAQGRA